MSNSPVAGHQVGFNFEEALESGRHIEADGYDSDPEDIWEAASAADEDVMIDTFLAEMSASQSDQSNPEAQIADYIAGDILAEIGDGPDGEDDHEAEAESNDGGEDSSKLNEEHIEDAVEPRQTLGKRKGHGRKVYFALYKKNKRTQKRSQKNTGIHDSFVYKYNYDSSKHTAPSDPASVPLSFSMAEKKVTPRAYSGKKYNTTRTLMWTMADLENESIRIIEWDGR